MSVDCDQAWHIGRVDHHGQDDGGKDEWRPEVMPEESRVQNRVRHIGGPVSEPQEYRMACDPEESPYGRSAADDTLESPESMGASRPGPTQAGMPPGVKHPGLEHEHFYSFGPLNPSYRDSEEDTQNPV